MVNTSVHIEETERQALTRQLAKRKAEGVQIRRDHKDGRHYASSTSKPGHWHLVAGYSCDCRGFVAHQRCKHHAALLAAKGWLGGTPEPDSGMAITCAHTDGYYSLDRAPEWQEPRTDFMVDGDVKVRIVGDTFGLSVPWIEQGRPIDDLTGCTPSYLDHYECVRYWIESLDTRVPAHVPMQNAGLFNAGEFVDAQPLVA